MGVKRGSFEQIKRGNVWRQDAIAAGVPNIDAGRALRQLAVAKQAEAAAIKAKWDFGAKIAEGLEGVFAGGMKLYTKEQKLKELENKAMEQAATQRVNQYLKTKDMLQQQMIDSFTALDNYETGVANGTVGMNQDEMNRLKAAFEASKEKYVSWTDYEPESMHVVREEPVGSWGSDISKESMRQHVKDSIESEEIGKAAVEEVNGKEE